MQSGSPLRLSRRAVNCVSATMGLSWDPFSTVSWAKVLGLAHVPLFGSTRSVNNVGDLAVLLDGRRSSVGLYAAGDTERLVHVREPLSWSWSANLRHSLIVTKR